ncbi:hypothetical protein NIES4074_62310 (plasmid) [Cylindrospermum sp. NIES-4074]|nr:hypothetical protein NIES4074_62310 [Cylindrospermum sp. NIES-4074]
MKPLKISSQKDLYISFYKLLNILGPIAGIGIIVGSSVFCYVQTRPQNLPVTHILTHGDHTFKLEVASTPEQLQKGLKFRASLNSDRGMLFNLGKDYYNVPFWMFQVQFPLDIIFLKNGVVTTVVKEAPPCTIRKTPCPIYRGRVANQVLELAPGSANIRVGEQLNIQPLLILSKKDISFDSKTSLLKNQILK